tara:strand:+ start:17189 stop:18202 length:1014 start_codon:yes stop_codon:yes gene_type:complete
MSVFGPNQVEELIIGNAVASETTAATFIASATDEEIKVLSADGTAPAVGEDFKLLQKTGSTITGLNYEFSDTIPADKVDRVTLKEYAAETLKSVRVEGFDGNLVANTTYAVEIRHFSDNSSLSPENFSVVTGYWTSGAVAPASAAIVRNGIVAALNHNLNRQGGGDFVITTPDATETDILITGAAQVALPGKITGRQIEFEVTAKQFDDTAVNHDNLGLLTTTLVASNNPGNGTGKYAVNLEWFTKGYKYEVYRQTGFPADFTERTPFYASQSLNYNSIHLTYKKSRISPTVEEQPRVLTILCERANLAGNAVANAVLADLRTVLGSANVPADLAVA